MTILENGDQTVKIWSNYGKESLDSLFHKNADGTFSQTVVMDGETVGLTNTELRATDLKVTLDGEQLTIANPGLTDAQLRLTPLTIILSASELHLGKVGGQSIPKSVTITRPANTTAYHAKDAIGTSLAVSDSTNASPIVITTPTHGLIDGDYVTISGITGNTNANGSFYVKVTGYSTLTFALYSDAALTTPVAGNGAHGGSGLVAQLFRLKDFFRVNGGDGYISKIRIMTNLATFLDQIKIHFYNTPVAAQLDHAQLPLLWSNIANRLGPAVLPALTTEGTGSDSSGCIGTPGDSQSSLPLQVFATALSRDLWFKLETLGTGTPASGQQFFVEVTLDSN
jgi:hypothetical protein